MQTIELYGRLVRYKLTKKKALNKFFKKLILQKLQEGKTCGFLYDSKMVNHGEWKINLLVNID